MSQMPDKIWLHKNTKYSTADTVCGYQYKFLAENEGIENFVEYARSDAFIEKALKWYCLDCECNDNCNADHKCFFRQEYKRYLEGNDNAVPPKFDNAILPDENAAENYRYRHFIRKMQDAFIEKAANWLRTHSEADYFELIPYNYCGAGNLNKKKMIEDFKKYMEE